MRSLTRSNRGWLRNPTAAGLVPLLLLASVPSCGGWSVDPMPTWPKVQGVKPGTKTEVQLYRDKASQGRQKIKGRFLSATDDFVTLELTERVHTDLRTRTFQKSDVRKVLTHRPTLKRWAGWAAMLFTAGWGALVPFPYSGDSTRAERFLGTLILSVPISIPFFIGSRMGRDLRSSSREQGLATVARSGGGQGRWAEQFQVTRNSRLRDHSWPS